MRVGLISDTHGLLRPEAVRALSGVDRIVHAGDIGRPEILDELNAIAPLVAVRGNNDRDAWARTLPHTEVLEIEDLVIYVLHDIDEIDLAPQAAGFQVVVSGHSHRPAVTHKDGVLFVNPGSAGPRRFSLPVSVAFLDVQGGEAWATIQVLEIG